MFEYEDENDNYDEPPMQGIPVDIINKWKETEFDIQNQELNLAILDQAIQLSEKHWLWRFKKPKYKSQVISDTYHSLLNIINVNK